MIYARSCMQCEHSDKERQKDGKIRCTRFSRWVQPVFYCDEYTYRIDWSLGAFKNTLLDIAADHHKKGVNTDVVF